MLEPGDAVGKLLCNTGSVTFPEGGRLISLIIPHKALAPLLREPEDCVARPMHADWPAVRLLRGYLEMLNADWLAPRPDLQRLTVAHVHDLAATMLGATRDAAERAKGRGIAAARLHALKNDIAANLGTELSLETVAARHRIGPRYARMLFEREGTTFSEFVRDRRLEEAHRMMLSPRFERLSVAEIAYEAGFNDVSYFNRAFRRRFNATPSDIRHAPAVRP